MCILQLVKDLKFWESIGKTLKKSTKWFSQLWKNWILITRIKIRDMRLQGQEMWQLVLETKFVQKGLTTQLNLQKK